MSMGSLVVVAATLISAALVMPASGVPPLRTNSCDLTYLQANVQMAIIL